MVKVAPARFKIRNDQVVATTRKVNKEKLLIELRNLWTHIKDCKPMVVESDRNPVYVYDGSELKVLGS